MASMASKNRMLRNEYATCDYITFADLVYVLRSPCIHLELQQITLHGIAFDYVNEKVYHYNLFTQHMEEP